MTLTARISLVPLNYPGYIEILVLILSVYSSENDSDFGYYASLVTSV